MHLPRKRDVPELNKPGPYAACAIDFDKDLNESAGWKPFNRGDRWGGRIRHFFLQTWNSTEFNGKTIVFKVRTGRKATGIH